MRAIWSGSISFGLLNVPIKLFKATESPGIGFRLLCKKHLEPIHQQDICGKGEVISRADEMRGFEVEKGVYVPVDESVIKEMKPKGSKIFDLIGFIKPSQLDPIFNLSTYYVVPQNKKEKAYFLLKSVMEEKNLIGFGKIIMRTNEYLAALSSYEEGMLLTTLHYPREIRPLSVFEKLIEKPALSTKERQLSKELISKLRIKNFDISIYRNVFKKELIRYVKATLVGKEKDIVFEKEKPSKKETLVKLLKKSIKKGKA